MAKVSQWASLDHTNVIRVYKTAQNLNLRVEFCATGSVRDVSSLGFQRVLFNL